MTHNPIRGASSADPNKSADNPTKTSANSQIEKVEKIGEVDPEQQSRARKFRAFVEEEPQKDLSKLNLPSPISLLPTKGKTNLNSQSPLPESKKFWKDIDEPIPKESSKPQKFVETSPQSAAKKDSKGFTPSEHLGIPIKGHSAIAPKEQGSLLPNLTEKPSEEKLSSPISRYLNKEEEKINSLMPTELKQRKEKSKESKSNPLMPTELGQREEKEKSKEDKTNSFMPTELEQRKERSKEGKKANRDASSETTASTTPSLPSLFNDKGRRDQPAVDLVPPSAQHLPSEIIPMAMSATASATPYLKTEVTSLFYQMVGTIYVMTKPPGVTRTEIILNADSFSQSKFYGASIIIEKYASAPDSFNIRLTGSNEAVTAFNQNIPYLMNAFRKGNFSFGIGRIEAEYKDEKPIFRRKEKQSGTDLGGQFTDKDH